jgi:histone deacetylase 6
MSVGLVFDERFLLHRAPYDHPEHPGRLSAIQSEFEQRGFLALCRRVPARPSSDEELFRVHTADLVRQIDATAKRSFTQLDPDTYAGPDSSAAARLAAGGLIDLAVAVWRGDLTSGFALVRPPGHHAEADQAMGFCLFNNVAVAARAVRAAGASRVLIVDWDVHHGNGTQNTFWDDSSVLYFSTHQYPFYPGTGSLEEVGGREAPGRTVNVPWPAGMGDVEYLEAFDRVLLPIARRFEPELVLVSAGFDAAAGDLLGSMRISPAGYAAMTSRLQEMAKGRLVLALEGGYNLKAIQKSAAECLRALLGRPESHEVHSGATAPVAKHLLSEVIRVQTPHWPGVF